MRQHYLYNSRNLRYLFIGISLLLLVLVSVLFGITMRQQDMILAQVHDRAAAIFENIVLTRRWNASYGGVFVHKVHGVESNPYLKNPDITTTSGEVYTKKNPALMTREISRLAARDGKFAYHITSLKLLNEHNQPDPWETKALRSFEQGNTEEAAVTTLHGQKVYRLMRPLAYEQGCVSCHKQQGYTLGDIRGGISVAIPFGHTEKALKKNQRTMLILGILLALTLALILYVFVWRLINRLSTQNVELEDLDRYRKRFMGIAAHDLRNPINTILGNTKLLEQNVFGQVSDEQQSVLERTRRASERMLRLISDLLDMNMIESGQLQLQTEPIDLSAFLREIYHDMLPVAQAKEIDLALQLDSKLPTAAFDRDRIRQVIDNLLSNALKFSPRQSKIEITARSLNQEVQKVQILITDHGPGIPPSEQNKLFKAFSQTSVKPTEGESSTGLGLSICRQIAEAHQGTLTVESIPGEGTTFVLTLPLTRMPRQSGATPG